MEAELGALEGLTEEEEEKAAQVTTLVLIFISNLSEQAIAAKLLSSKATNPTVLSTSLVSLVFYHPHCLSNF
jgi:hypothetical protein